MYIALALKCWQENSSPELVECPKTNGVEADTCITFQLTYGGEKLEQKNCGNIDVENRKYKERFHPEIQITQDKCLKITDKMNEAVRKKNPGGDPNNRANYLCGCSTDGCNEQQLQQWTEEGSNDNDNDNETEEGSNDNETKEGSKGSSNRCQEGKVFPLAIVGFYLMKKIIDQSS